MTLAVYILGFKGQDEGAETIIEQWKATKAEVASEKKIEQELQGSETAWVAAIVFAYSGEIWGSPVRLQVGSTCVLEMHNEVLSQ